MPEGWGALGTLPVFVKENICYETKKELMSLWKK
jgi:hypothetical protein